MLVFDRRRNGTQDASTKIIYVCLIVFFLLIVVSVGMTSFKMYSTAVNEILKSNNTILEQMRKNTDMSLLNIESQIDSYLKSETLKDYIAMPERNPFIVIENKQQLMNMVESNERVDAIYIYTFKDGQILSQSGISSVPETFDSEFTNSLHELEGEKWFGIDFRKTFGQSGDAVLRYAKKLPGKQQAALILDINENLLFDAISKHLDSSEGIFLICDSNATILSHADKRMLAVTDSESTYMQKILSSKISKASFEDTYNNDKSFISYNRSSHNGWYYINIIPKKNFINIVIGSILTIIIFSLMLYAAAVFVSIYFIRRSLSPINKFIKSVSASIRSGSSKSGIATTFGDLNKLEAQLTDMVYFQHDMEKKLQSSYEAIKWRTVMNLLLGFTNDYQNALSSLELAGTPMYSENFIVFVVELCDRYKYMENGQSQELNIICSSIRMQLEEYINEETRGCAIIGTGGTVIAIISFDILDERKNILAAFSIAESTINFTRKYLNHDAWIGIGRIYRDMKDIHRSYYDAYHALKYKFVSGKPGILSIDDFNMEENISMPDVLKRMDTIASELLVRSDEEIYNSVSAVITDICKKNVTNDVLKQFALYFITLPTIKYPAIAKKLESLKDYSDVYASLNHCRNVSQVTDIIYSSLISMKLAANDAQQNNATTSPLIEKVIRYIDENYADKNISLALVADKFNISAPHLSRIFKKETSQRFIDYIIYKRIERSKEILLTTNMRISEVGNAVGYETQASFMRIFKKYTGKTPTAWKAENRDPS